MGYANIAQVGRGIHLRQFARAFVVEDGTSKRVAFVSVDAGMMGYGVKREVRKLNMICLVQHVNHLQRNEYNNNCLTFHLITKVMTRLKARYGDIYHNDNVVISGTHTHGGPGGFLMHLLYDISILGFVPQTFEALVNGIYLVSLSIYIFILSFFISFMLLNTEY